MTCDAEKKISQDGELGDHELESVTGSGGRTGQKNPKDSISDMTQADMLQLQQLMNQKGQLEQMISNTMKASSETQSGLAANLKD